MWDHHAPEDVFGDLLVVGTVGAFDRCKVVPCDT
jgi:hypothetical protein